MRPGVTPAAFATPEMDSFPFVERMPSMTLALCSYRQWSLKSAISRAWRVSRKAGAIQNLVNRLRSRTITEGFVLSALGRAT